MPDAVYLEELPHDGFVNPMTPSLAARVDRNMGPLCELSRTCPYSYLGNLPGTFWPLA